MNYFGLKEKISIFEQIKQSSILILRFKLFNLKLVKFLILFFQSQGFIILQKLFLK